MSAKSAKSAKTPRRRKMDCNSYCVTSDGVAKTAAHPLHSKPWRVFRHCDSFIQMKILLSWSA